MFLRSRRLGRRPPAAGFAISIAPLAAAQGTCAAGARSACSAADGGLPAAVLAPRSSRSASLPRALLARDGLLRALAGAGVGAGALPVDRQAPAVPDALVAADLHLALDVLRHLAAEVTLD